MGSDVLKFINLQERNLFLFLCFYSFVSFTICAYFYFFTKKTKILYPYISLHIFLTGWSLGFIIVLLSNEKEILLQKLGCWLVMSSMCFTSVAWLYYCIRFSNYSIKNKWVQKILISLPLVILWFYYTIGIFDSVLFFYPYNKWQISNHNYMSLITVMLPYAFCGQVILLKCALRLKSRQKADFFLILASSLILFTIFPLRILLKFPLEIIPAAFTISATTSLFIESLRNKLFGIVPISIFSFTEFIAQAICLVDKNSKVIGLNKAFHKIFGYESIQFEHEPVIKLVEYLNPKIISIDGELNIYDFFSSASSCALKIELGLNLDTEKVFMITTHPISAPRGNILGRLIFFNDITEVKMLHEKMKTLNNELFELNEELSEVTSQLACHAYNAEELSIQKERNNILSDLHDSIGQVYTSNFSLLRCAKASLEKDNVDEAVESLGDICRITEDGLMEVESTLYLENSISKESLALSNILEKLAFCYSKTNVSVKYKIDDNIDNLDFSINQGIYKMLQECITNSIKHGNAKNIYIEIRQDSGHLQIDAHDDGKGCAYVKNGLGLSGMKRRILQLGGELDYGPFENNNGFWIQAKIPFKDNEL